MPRCAHAKIACLLVCGIRSKTVHGRRSNFFAEPKQAAAPVATLGVTGGLVPIAAAPTPREVVVDRLALVPIP